MKKGLGYLLAALVLLAAGCAGGAQEEMTELWVVTEASKTDGMNYQARMAAEAFEQAHPGITVKLEILELEKETDRESYLQQLRTQIMAGEGPDVYLLPTGDTVTTGTPTTVNKYTVEPLFADVRQAMASGLFWDLSQWYDADTALHTEELHPDIMAAGCLGDARYVLPLRFDMSVFMVDEDNWTASGMDGQVLEKGLLEIGWETVNRDSTDMAAYGLQLPEDHRVLPKLYDYETGEMLVTQAQIEDYLRLYQRWKEASARQAEAVDEEWARWAFEKYPDNFWNINGSFATKMTEPPEFDITVYDRIRSFENYGLYWAEMGFPVYTEGTEYLTDAILQGKRLRETVSFRILPDTAGQTHALVTYYGAVGSGCSRPDLAYEYLREFLSRENQWDISRPKIDWSLKGDKPPEMQCYVQIEESWPVRVYGSGEYLWANRQYQLHNGSGKNRRILGTAGENVLSEEDFAVVTAPIDVVEFPFAQAEGESLSDALEQLNEEDGTPTSADIESIAREVYENLWWHLAEG